MQRCGEVTTVMLLPASGGFKTAYVRFADESGAKLAVEKMNGWRPRINTERYAASALFELYAGVDIEACVTCRGWIVTLPGASPAATPPSGTGSTETGSQTTSQPVPNSGDMVEQCKRIIARGLADNVTMSRLTTLFEYCGTSLSL